MKHIVRNAYSPRTRVLARIGTGKAKQNHKDECNVNLILAKFQKTGVITHRQEHEGQYGDASGIDYQEALNLVIKADNMFKELPSSVRKKFSNNPAEFMEFVNNPDNMPEMIEMGLAVDNTPQEAPPQKVEIVNTSPEA